MSTVAWQQSAHGTYTVNREVGAIRSPPYLASDLLGSAEVTLNTSGTATASVR